MLDFAMFLERGITFQNLQNHIKNPKLAIKICVWA